MNTFRKYLSAGVGLAALILATAASAAEVRWSLTFFSDQGGKIGSGDFSYDAETVDFINLVHMDAPDEYPYGFNTTTKLDTLSVNIDGRDWYIPGAAWWTDGERSQGSVIVHRYGNFEQSSWFFGDPHEGMFGMEMASFAKSNNNLWSGGWGSYLTVPGSDRTWNVGTWIAKRDNPAHELVSPVPVPATLPLFLGALGALGVAMRRRRTS